MTPLEVALQECETRIEALIDRPKTIDPSALGRTISKKPRGRAKQATGSGSVMDPQASCPMPTYEPPKVAGAAIAAIDLPGLSFPLVFAAPVAPVFSAPQQPPQAPIVRPEENNSGAFETTITGNSSTDIGASGISNTTTIDTSVPVAGTPSASLEQASTGEPVNDTGASHLTTTPVDTSVPVGGSRPQPGTPSASPKQASTREPGTETKPSAVASDDVVRFGKLLKLEGYELEGFAVSSSDVEAGIWALWEKTAAPTPTPPPTLPYVTFTMAPVARHHYYIMDMDAFCASMAEWTVRTTFSFELSTTSPPVPEAPAFKDCGTSPEPSKYKDAGTSPEPYMVPFERSPNSPRLVRGRGWPDQPESKTVGARKRYPIVDFAEIERLKRTEIELRARVEEAEAAVVAAKKEAEEEEKERFRKEAEEKKRERLRVEEKERLRVKMEKELEEEGAMKLSGRVEMGVSLLLVWLVLGCFWRSA